MNYLEALALEAKLSDTDDTANEIRAIGTIRTTDEDNNTTTVEAFYSAKDVLELLDKGMSIRDVIDRLGGVSVSG